MRLILTGMSGVPTEMPARRASFTASIPAKREIKEVNNLTDDSLLLNIFVVHIRKNKINKKTHELKRVWTWPFLVHKQF